MHVTTVPSTSIHTPKNPELHSESLVSLCKWWESTHAQSDPLPHLCHEYTSPDRLLSMPMAPPMQYNFARIASGMLATSKEVESDNMPVEHALHGTGRSLGLVGISLGVLFMLLIIAAISCIRRRKTMLPDTSILSHTHTVLTVQTQASKEDRPPDYTMVLRMKEEEEENLPSYRQAVAKQATDKEDTESKEQRVEIESIGEHQDSEDDIVDEYIENIENITNNIEEHRDHSYICTGHERLEITNKSQDITV